MGTPVLETSWDGSMPDPEKFRRDLAILQSCITTGGGGIKGGLIIILVVVPVSACHAERGGRGRYPRRGS